MKELKIKLMERMLGAEMTAHLGYEDGKGAPADEANHRRLLEPIGYITPTEDEEAFYANMNKLDKVA